MANDESARLSLSKIHNVPPGRILVSLSDLCEMLGMTRNPVMEKISQGLPYLEKGSQQKPKRAWSFDSKAVIDWLCEQARQEGHEQAMRKLGGMSPTSADGEGGGYGPKPGEDMIEYRGRVADTHGKEIKTALAARQVIRVHEVVYVFTAYLADPKNTLQSVKGRVMAYLDKLGAPGRV